MSFREVSAILKMTKIKDCHLTNKKKNVLKKASPYHVEALHVS